MPRILGLILFLISFQAFAGEPCDRAFERSERRDSEVFTNLTELSRRLMREAEEGAVSSRQELAYRVLHFRRIVFQNHAYFRKGSSRYIVGASVSRMDDRAWTYEDQQILMWLLILQPETESSYLEGLETGASDPRFPYVGDLREIRRLTEGDSETWQALVGILQDLQKHLPRGHIVFWSTSPETTSLNYRKVSEYISQEMAKLVPELSRKTAAFGDEQLEFLTWVRKRYPLVVAHERAERIESGEVPWIEGDPDETAALPTMGWYKRTFEDILAPGEVLAIQKPTERREAMAELLKKSWREVLRHFQLLREGDLVRFQSEVSRFKEFAAENYDEGELRYMIHRIHGPYRNGIFELHPDLIWLPGTETSEN